MITFTVLFKNMQTLKFKSQLTFVYFAAVNHLKGPLRIQNFIINGFKRSWFVICDWRILLGFVCFCVLRFIACNHN